MSKRLNAQLHNMIVRNVVTAKYGEQEQKLQDELSKIKLRIGNRMATEIAKKLKSVPNVFFGPCGSIPVKIKGHVYKYPVNSYTGFVTVRGRYTNRTEEEEITYPELPVKDKDVVALEKAEATQIEFKEEIQAFEAKVTSVVYGCSTVNQLLKVWPESAKFIPAEAGMNALIPAGTVEDLNKSLGL